MNKELSELKAKLAKAEGHLKAAINAQEQLRVAGLDGHASLASIKTIIEARRKEVEKLSKAVKLGKDLWELSGIIRECAEQARSVIFPTGGNTTPFHPGGGIGPLPEFEPIAYRGPSCRHQFTPVTTGLTTDQKLQLMELAGKSAAMSGESHADAGATITAYEKMLAVILGPQVPGQA